MLIERGRELLGAGRIWEALEAFYESERAGEPADECSAGRWHCYMLLGHFERAWAESDAICARNAPDPHRLWDGRPFEGRRVIIRCLHGLGDALQFLRYAPRVRELAEQVIVQTAPELLRLASGICGVDYSMTWSGPENPEPFWDQQIEVMELPRAFRTRVDTIPLNLPYFKLPDQATRTARQIIDSSSTHLKVGLLWNSSSWKPARSIPFRNLLPLLNIPGVHFYSFQLGEQRAELEGIARILDAMRAGGDVAATAAKVALLDLVITVDTMMAHLAGSLGVPVWVMLPYDADWRWMQNTDRSPWYPRMRLFRQSTPDDWPSVTDRIERDLCAMAHGVR